MFFSFYVFFLKNMTSRHWENVFRKIFETVIYTSYLDAQAAQFQQFTVFWWPLSIEKSVLQKSVFLIRIKLLRVFFNNKVRKNMDFVEN